MMHVVVYPALQYSLQTHQPTRPTFYPSHAALVRSGGYCRLANGQLFDNFTQGDAATYA